MTQLTSLQRSQWAANEVVRLEALLQTHPHPDSDALIRRDLKDARLDAAVFAEVAQAEFLSVLTASVAQLPGEIFRALNEAASLTTPALRRTSKG